MGGRRCGIGRARRPSWLAVLAVAALVAPAAAQTNTAPSQTQPSAILVMPFDATGGRTSFALVSRVGPISGPAALATHWVYYAADCRHLADLSIGLTPNDTVVVDASQIQSQTQELGLPVNQPLGPVIDLSGERGVIIISAEVPQGVSAAQLIGAWTIGNLTAGVAFGADAVGFASATLPDPTNLDAEGLVIPTFNPSMLDTSEVIVIGLEEDGDTLVPIDRESNRLHGAHVCCNTAISDTLESLVSVPDICFACALFAPIAPTRIPSPDPPIVPLVSAEGSGMLHLTACRTAGASPKSLPTLLGQGDFRQYLVAFHGQAVGPFGLVTSGKYATPEGGD